MITMKTILKLACFILTFNLLISCNAQEVPGTYRVTFMSKMKLKNPNGTIVERWGQAGGSAVAYEKIEGDRVKFLTAGHLWWDGAKDHLVHIGEKKYKVLKHKEYFSKSLDESLIEFHTAYVDTPTIPLAFYNPAISDEVQFSGFPDGKPETSTCLINDYHIDCTYFRTKPPMPRFGYSGGPVIHDGHVIGIVSAFDRISKLGIHINVGLLAGMK